MTPDQATEFARRIVDKIDAMAEIRNAPADFMHRAADRERVASDLAGLREHHDEGRSARPACFACSVLPCPDARRYAEGLTRTGRLYGVRMVGPYVLGPDDSVPDVIL